MGCNSPTIEFIQMHMYKLAISLALALTAFGQTTYEIDSTHSAAQFAVRHLMVSNVRGNLGKITGTIQYDPASLDKSSVKATVDVKGLDTRQAKRDAHLRSAEFFDAENHPTITFESTRFWKEGNTLKVAGNLTIRGTTKPVTLTADVSEPVKNEHGGGSRIGAQVTTKLNRKDYGVAYNKLMEGGGAIVGDEVSITIDIEATAK